MQFGSLGLVRMPGHDARRVGSWAMPSLWAARRGNHVCGQLGNVYPRGKRRVFSVRDRTLQLGEISSLQDLCSRAPRGPGYWIRLRFEVGLSYVDLIITRACLSYHDSEVVLTTVLVLKAETVTPTTTYSVVLTLSTTTSRFGLFQ